ncbi:MAG: InlB B-repeat-containing protein [Lachnospiraceae bacterium]|nr:InlB B-repeat-containing protein [Lachnospiraceae bacterium]
MMKVLKTKKFLAAIGLLVTIGIVLTAVLTLTKSNRNNPAVTPTPTPAVDTTDYKEVRFALPEGVSELDAANTKLPETAMIPKGTRIADLASPKQAGKVFLGWYYDNNLKLMTGPDDTIESNLTLYPRFGARPDLEDVFSYDFVASDDVPADFAIFVAGHNLSEENVKELIAVRNISLGDEPMQFSLKEIKKAEKKQEETKEYQTSDDPEEAKLLALLKESGIDLSEMKGVPNLNEVYGLDENDSPARYWREELGYDPETVLALLAAYEEVQKDAWDNVTVYQVVPEGGTWNEGQLQQVEILDSSSMRFLVDDKETEPDIVFYNIAVSREEFNNLTVNSDVMFIPFADVSGIDKLDAMYKVSEDGNDVTKNNASGSFVYTKGGIAPGTTVAIYNGTLSKDGRVDGEVGYYKVRESLGNGKYAYGGADFTDVLFLPDVIPVKDDGTFQDGSVKLDASVLSFNGAAYSHLRLGKNTKVDPGDYLYFYTGNAKAVKDLNVIGVGRITGVTEDGKNLIVKYDISSRKEVENYGMHEELGQIEIPLDGVQKEALSKSIVEQMKESTFAEQTGDYVLRILNGEMSFPDDPDLADALRNMTFKTEDGDDITVEELRLLASTAKQYSVSGKDVNITIVKDLEHFGGTGIRVVISAGLKITIDLNGNNKLEIQVSAAFEQEVALGLKIDGYFNLLDLENTTVDISLRAGTYTGFGAQATVMTVEKNTAEDSEWSDLLKATGAGNGTEGDSKKLLNMAEKLGSIKENIDKSHGGTYAKGKGPGSWTSSEDYDGAQYATAGGDLPTKYKAMLDNKSEYIELAEQELFKFSVRPPGPLSVIEFSLEGKLVLKFKVNAMLGFSISYSNEKQLCYHIEPFKQIAKSSTADIEAPSFRVDFFVFGMLGIRAGVVIDGRVGLLSTVFDSIGVTAEVGLYAEVYGFLYMYYSWKAVPNSKEGIVDKNIEGSLLFEVGSYLDINFVAQLGNGKLQEAVKIYEKKWPLIQLGATEVPVPFRDNQEELAAVAATLEIESGKNTVKVPDEIFNVDMMALDSGEVTRKSQDSKKLGEASYEFEINGRKYIQYNEKHFDVTCYDLDGENGNITENHSFQYFPATNEIYIKPVDNDTDEVWGLVTFTYRNDSFGFYQMEFKRTLKVHWKGEPCTASVEFYIQKPGTSRLDGMYPEKIKDLYELADTGSFHGFDGIEYDLFITDDFVYKYDGYRLLGIDYPGVGDYQLAVDEAKKKYNAAVKRYNEMCKEPADKYTFQQYKDASDDISKASKEWSQKKESFETYYTNIQDALSTRNGTLHFLMVKNETIVRLYFDIAEHEVPVLRVSDMSTGETNDGNPFLYGYSEDYWNFGGKTGTKGVATIGVHEKLLDKVKELTADYDPEYDLEYYVFYPKLKEYRYQLGIREGLAKLFIYDVPFNTRDTLLNINWYREHVSEWKPLTADMRMPDDDVVLIVHEKKSTKSHNVTWVDDFGEVLREDSVVYDELLSEAPETPERKRFGYEPSRCWRDQDGTVVAEDYRMPAHDITLTLEWVYDPLPQPIKWEALGFTWETVGPKTGEPVYAIGQRYAGDKPEEFKRTTGGLITIQKQGHETKVTVVYSDGTEVAWEEFDKKMPAGGITLKYYFVPMNYKVTWMDGDKVIKTETVLYGSVLHAPKVTIGENEVVKWVYADDEKIEIYDGYSLVGGNTTLRTLRHTHQWDDGVRKEPDCANVGWMKYTCQTCGAERREDIPKDPNNHYKVSVHSSKRADCVGPQVDTYYCLGCKQYWDVVIGEKDPNYHSQYEMSGHRIGREEAETPATCDKEGLTSAKYCEDCGALLEGGEVIPKKPHDWNEPTYEWSADKSQVIAKRVCKNDSSHVETETAKTVTRIARETTCGEKGSREYAATFTNPAFAKQTDYEVIDMIPHEWGEVTYRLSDDKRTVVATRYCIKNGNHFETETAPVETKIKKAATELETGILLYSAAFRNSALGTWEQEEVIPVSVCSHEWVTETKRAWVEMTATEVATLHPAEQYEICSKCRKKKEGSTVEVPITPTLTITQVDFYDFLSEDQELYHQLDDKVVWFVDGKTKIAIPLATSPDGTGSFTLELFAMNYDESVENITLADLEEGFQSGTITEFVIPITLGFGSPDYPGAEYEERFLGYEYEGPVVVMGQTSYFKEARVNFTITGNHKHSWKDVYEKPYYTNYGGILWYPSVSYKKCETCGMRKDHVSPLLKPYVYDARAKKVLDQKADNVYEFHVPVTSHPGDEITIRKLMNRLYVDDLDMKIGILLSEEWMRNGWIWDSIFDLFYSEDGTRSGEDVEYLSGGSIWVQNPKIIKMDESLTNDSSIYNIKNNLIIEYDVVWRSTIYQQVKIRLIIEPRTD